MSSPTNHLYSEVIHGTLFHHSSITLFLHGMKGVGRR